MSCLDFHRLVGILAAVINEDEVSGEDEDWMLDVEEVFLCRAWDVAHQDARSPRHPSSGAL